MVSKSCQISFSERETLTKRCLCSTAVLSFSFEKRVRELEIPCVFLRLNREIR